MAECLWDPSRKCDCSIGKSSILAVDAAALAFAVGRGERLRQELAGYGCQSAKEEGEKTADSFTRAEG